MQGFANTLMAMKQLWNACTAGGHIKTKFNGGIFK